MVDKINETAHKFAEACKVPSLKKKIGEIPIQNEHFTEFKESINSTLPILFDIFHQNRAVLMSTDDEDYKKNVEFKISFVKVICEQTSSNDIFITDSENIHRQIKEISEKYMMKIYENDEKFQEKLWISYEDHLKGELWMYELGEIFGFLQFVKIVSNKFGLKDRHISFLLLFGLSLTDFHDPEFQIVGIKIFNEILDERNVKLLKETNIHQVIYDNVFKLTKKSSDAHFFDQLWTCLFKFVIIEEKERKSFKKWNRIDDLMEALFESLAFESNILASHILLSKLIKFLALDLDEIEIETLDTLFWNSQKCGEAEVIEKLKTVEDFQNYRYYRWMKKIFLLIPNEIGKCGGPYEDASKYLNGIHILYLLSLYPIDTKMIEHTLASNLETLIKVFIELVKAYKNDSQMIHVIKSFESTLIHHFKDVESLNLLEKVSIKLWESIK